MRVVIFCHSLKSCWNHGNAHFLRGIASELAARGHDVRIWEPADGWSRENVVRDHGADALERYREAYPALESTEYDIGKLNLNAALEDAGLVLVHEWNEPSLVAAIGEHRAKQKAGYVLLFHDTHHRSASDPGALRRYDLRHYDGVLAFGSVIRDIYLKHGWARRAWTWHEAADTRVFYPRPAEIEPVGDLVWIGNWGEGERTAELEEFLIGPVRDLRLRARIYGVRYPEPALEALRSAGIEYAGWLPNHRAPEVFASHRVTVHVPRRFYSTLLPGVPTIRVFEALACGIPLVSAPWADAEGLFTPGEDFLVARDANEMRRHLATLFEDATLRRDMAERGFATIRARHTCAHRVDELMQVYEEITAPVREVIA
ncbi:MAG TPA: glycosyltransferase [Bryobacteraceae bacterium]|nr:glycosyltransferase [Bryobacteraceae bacterium]